MAPYFRFKVLDQIVVVVVKGRRKALFTIGRRCRFATLILMQVWLFVTDLLIFFLIFLFIYFFLPKSNHPDSLDFNMIQAFWLQNPVFHLRQTSILQTITEFQRHPDCFASFLGKEIGIVAQVSGRIRDSEVIMNKCMSKTLFFDTGNAAYWSCHYRTFPLLDYRVPCFCIHPHVSRYANRYQSCICALRGFEYVQVAFVFPLSHSPFFFSRFFIYFILFTLCLTQISAYQFLGFFRQVMRTDVRAKTY